MLYYIIPTIVSIIVCSIMFFCLYEQRIKRESRYEKWNRYKWKFCNDNKRVKFPLYAHLIMYTLSFVPVVNIIIIFVLTLIYILQLNILDDDYILESERLVINSKPLNYLTKILKTRI